MIFLKEENYTVYLVRNTGKKHNKKGFKCRYKILEAIFS